MILALLCLVAIIAGAVASIAGFGVGSLLTPALATQVPFKLAVASITFPHLVATAVRFWTMRAHVDKRVLLWFGIASAIAGLSGALLHEWATNAALTAVFGCLLIFAGLSGLLGFMQRLKLGRKSALAAGALSGLFGGMVGNQGGIRSAALLGFGLPRDRFVGTAAAIALIVDGARAPIYLWSDGREILAIWPTIAALTVAVVVGTLAGRRVLSRIPERVFSSVVSAIILLLGVYMLMRVIA